MLSVEHVLAFHSPVIDVDNNAFNNCKQLIFLITQFCVMVIVGIQLIQHATDVAKNVAVSFTGQL
ncbi:Uncharacterised protein [Enterobacter hormaechei]|nr:Uncharacterised protein [Enterobacter hormaechei]